MTGNGDFDAGVGDYGDSFLELTPDNSTQPTNKNGYGLSVTDYFTPFNEQTLSDNDTDLGSAGPLLLPDQSGWPTPMRWSALARASPCIWSIATTWAVTFQFNRSRSECCADGFSEPGPGQPGIFQQFDLFSRLQHCCTKGLSAAIRWKAFGRRSGNGRRNLRFSGATPAISSYGFGEWHCVGDREHQGLYHQYGGECGIASVRRRANQRDLNELYNSGSALAGAGVKFTVPTVADGHVYVGTGGTLINGGTTTSAELAVFGLTFEPSRSPPRQPISPRRSRLFKVCRCS